MSVDPFAVIVVLGGCVAVAVLADEARKAIVRARRRRAWERTTGPGRVVAFQMSRLRPKRRLS